MDPNRKLAVRSVLGAFLSLGILFCGNASAANQAPIVNITAPLPGTSYDPPATIVISANASDPDGLITKVEFFRDGILIGSPVTVAPYTTTWSGVGPGTYNLTAKATDNGANGGKSTISAPVQVKVNTTVISSPATNAIINGRFVTVSGTYQGPNTTTVILTAGGGHSVVASSGGGSFSGTVALSRGPNTIEVQVARRDGTFEVAKRDVTAVDPPVVVITAPTSMGPYTVPAQVTLQADAASVQGTINKVEYFEGATSLGHAATAPYSVTTTLTSVGNHAIIARATDSFGFTADSFASIVLSAVPPNSPPDLILTAPTTDITATAPATVNFSATASDSNGVAYVEFLLNGQPTSPQLTTAPYNYTKTGLGVGTYVVSVRAADTLGAITTTSGGPTITVNAPNTPPTVAITSPLNNSTFPPSANITITADANDPDAGSSVSVEFYVGAELKFTDTTSPYSYAWQNVQPGNYVLTAVAVDNVGARTTSAPVNVRVAMPTGPGETIVFLHNDVVGSPLAATDTAGEVLWRESYKPFGDRVRREAASTSNRQWFTGKAEDAETGLSYFGARYYDPSVGRFMGIDAAPFKDKDLHTFNKYAYGNNNPYRHVDPDGNSPVDILFLAYDLYQLGSAIYSGEGVKGAVADVGISIVGVISPVPGTGVAIKAAKAGERALEAGKAIDHATSAKQGADLARHLGYSEKYGKAGVKELENGRIRYYGELQPANKAGEMAGRRYVHEFDPATGSSRGWHETLDHGGNVRQVRPEANNGKKHHQFDGDGKYTGSW